MISYGSLPLLVKAPPKSLLLVRVAHNWPVGKSNTSSPSIQEDHLGASHFPIFLVIFKLGRDPEGAPHIPKSSWDIDAQHLSRERSCSKF